MFEWLGKFIPPEIGGPVILAALLWVGLHYVLIGPEVGERLGTLHWQDQCTTAIEEIQHTRRAEHEVRRNRAIAAAARIKSEAEAAARLTRQKAEQLKMITTQMLPRELTNLFDAITGQTGVIERMTDMLTVPERPDMAELDLPEIPDLLPAPSPEGRSNFCGCVVDATLERARADLALYTGSLRLYTPETIARVADTLRETAQSSACGRIPG